MPALPAIGMFEQNLFGNRRSLSNRNTPRPGPWSGVNRGALDGQPSRDQLPAIGRARQHGACIMDAVTLIAFVASMFVAGRSAERRGRSFKNWAWIAASIGPFALPLIFLFPDLNKEVANRADEAISG
jgi:hypothetical protein